MTAHDTAAHAAVVSGILVIFGILWRIDQAIRWWSNGHRSR